MKTAIIALSVMLVIVGITFFLMRKKKTPQVAQSSSSVDPSTFNKIAGGYF